MKQKAKLDDVVQGNLPEHIIDALKEMTITIEELDEWAGSKPPIRFWVKGKRLYYEISGSVSTKKITAIVGSIGTVTGLAWLVIQNIEKLLELVR